MAVEMLILSGSMILNKKFICISLHLKKERKILELKKQLR
jgi:hypothetical protein